VDPLIAAHYRTIQPYIIRVHAAQQTILKAGALLAGMFVLASLPIGAALIFLCSLIGVGAAAVVLFAIGRMLFYSDYRLSNANGAMPCPKCGCKTGIYASWVCGSCHTTHTHARFSRSFFEPCKNCKNSPHSLICPRCRDPIIFDGKAFKPGHSAWCRGLPPVTAKPPVVQDRPPKRIRQHLR
jgi:hypothetical protein